MMNDFMSNRPLRLALLAVLVLLSLFLVAKTWDAAFGRDQFDPINTITVTGMGEASAVPDIAQINFTVTESAATVKEAQDNATKKTDAALGAVKKLGVADKDVKTASYNVSPKYEYQSPCPPGAMCTSSIVSGTPRIVGYDVSQSVEVKVRDTTKAGDVLQALGTLGVQNISGPNFMVDDDNGVKNEARAKAIADARAKAKELAKELGVSLGKVVSYSEGGNYPMAAYTKSSGMMDARLESAPTLPVGENTSNMTVNVTYEIR